MRLKSQSNYVNYKFQMTKPKIQINLFWILSFVICHLSLTSCAVKKLSPEPGNPKWGVDVRWHGQSCFSLEDSIKRTIVIDPFDETVGYGKLRLSADALLISHNHFDHNYVRGVKARLSEIDIVKSSGTYTVAAGLQVTALPSFHDNEKGQIHGNNFILTFVLGGLRIVHLGDIGQDELSDFQLNMISKVDILFIPVGGVTTLDAAKAKRYVDKLKPSAVFPMHYGNSRFYPLGSVDAFAKLFPADQVVRLTGSTVRIKEPDLTDKPIVYILQPTPRNE